VKCSIAIIGGTGVYDAEMLQNKDDFLVNTPFGEVTVLTGQYQEKRIAFLARHGSNHQIAPHRINYRANIWALAELGAERIIGTAAVGSLNPDMHPGDFVLLDQFIDFTHARVQTFFEGEGTFRVVGGPPGVFHVDVTHPYCDTLRNYLFAAGESRQLHLHKQGTYICTEGPRFETAAEISMFRQIGGDLVGMTNVPEVILAREMGLCYAAIAMVTNYAAGIAPHVLTHKEVTDIMEKQSESLRTLLMQTISALPEQRTGACCVSEYADEVWRSWKK